MKGRKSWDIFCKIVDNFGDIGVCWRLARQLHVEHELQIRLWVDDLNTAKNIIPNLDTSKNQQIRDGITVLHWTDKTDFTVAASVVIEAFACELPPAYLQDMPRQQSKWVNLEYLSAEPWVTDFHAKSSPQPQYNLTRHFYFPGFNENTGGLIRERETMPKHESISGEVLQVSLFCYPHAPIHDLLTAMASSKHAIDCYVPAGNILPKIASFFGKDSVGVGDKLNRNMLNLHVLPFLSQADYDKLLSACDINFVRGEDSWVRAIWAGKPFIWQPYLQDENVHIKKMDAFLGMFYAGCDAKDVVCKAHSAWASSKVSNQDWGNYLNELQVISIFTSQRSTQLAKQTDLASKLVIFCNKI